MPSVQTVRARLVDHGDLVNLGTANLLDWDSGPLDLALLCPTEGHRFERAISMTTWRRTYVP